MTMKALELLKELNENFVIEEDLNALKVIKINTKQIRDTARINLEHKQKKIQDIENNIRMLEKEIDRLSSVIDKLKAEQEQFAVTHQLDKTLKSIDVLENQVRKMRNELDLKIEKFVKEHDRSIKTSSENDTPVEDDINASSKILQLKLYRSLGVILDSEHQQVLIETKDPLTNDNLMDVLPLGEDLSETFVTKYIWDKLQCQM